MADSERYPFDLDIVRGNLERISVELPEGVLEGLQSAATLATANEVRELRKAVTQVEERLGQLCTVIETHASRMETAIAAATVPPPGPSPNPAESRSSQPGHHAGVRRS